MKDCRTENERKKPVVAMYYTYPDRVGGPLTYINTVMNSSLREKYDFRTVFQNRAPGGVDLALLREMTGQLRELSPDVVHIHGVQSEGFYGVLAAKLAGCRRIVMTVHGFAFDDSACTGVKRILYKKLVEPFSLRAADKVYCVCEFAAKRGIVVKNAGKRHCGHIYNPVPVPKLTVDRETLRQELGFAPQNKVFCMSGRVTRDKGFPAVEELLRRLRLDGVKVFRLLVLGNGDYFDEFSDNVREFIADGTVRMIGQTDRVADYLNASDGFLFPSLHENLSIALLEAGMAGLACIVSDVGGNPEIIRDGETGIVLREITPDALCDAVKRLLKEPDTAKKYGEAAKEDISARFSLESITQKIDRVYSE